jgi:hypothetical protein
VTELRFETLRMPSTDLGSPNPLPPLFGPRDLHETIAGDGLDDEMLRGLSYGRVASVLPYLPQDGYGRDLAEAEHPVAVLENEHLRATFLIALGGRLWSLIDQRTGRELLHVNPVFRPANLALRNAWFAGGVEWNLGTTGHWPLTCAPLHVARVERADGTPALRMYEYERMRGLVVRIDASLAPREPLLLVRVTITNPRSTEVPVYWWSNIAVPERDDVRVIAPADSAWQFGYTERLAKVPFPDVDGLDRSYTTRAAGAADYFFDLKRAELPWIAALDAQGRGLFHASTSRLHGRKLFLWGTGAGSAHWQRWLTDGDSRYLEIQAGLARTQLEHLPLPALSSWSWVEAYGLAEADAALVHGSDWAGAVAATADAVRATGAADAVHREEARDESADRVVELIARASGWGALEDARRRASGDAPLSNGVTPFPESDLGAEQRPWIGLLDPLGTAGRDSDSDAAPRRADEAPESYVIDPEWLQLLAERDTWDSHLHVGVVRAALGDTDGAERAWRTSLARAENGWAHRNLAALHAHRGDAREAAAEYRRARALLPHVVQLTIEALRHLVDSVDGAGALTLIDGLDDAQRANGRVRFAEARAALETGDLDRVGRLLEVGIEIADVKEGEVSLDTLWADFHERMLAADAGTPVTDEIRARAASEFPLPERYDFRMFARPVE